MRSLFDLQFAATPDEQWGGSVGMKLGDQRSRIGARKRKI